MNKMKLLRIVVPIALCSFAAALLIDRLQRPFGGREALLQLENKWLAAGDDPATLEGILAKDFVHVLPVGFVSRDEQITYMRYMKEHPQKLRPLHHFDDMRVRIFKDVGLVNGIVVETNERGEVLRKTLFTDVFAYRDGRWQAVSAQELPLQEPAGKPHP